MRAAGAQIDACRDQPDMSEEDKLVVETDVPERMQLFWRTLGDFSINDEREEAEWIYGRLSESALLTHEKDEVLKQIQNVLRLMHEEKLEVPFIACYCKEECSLFIEKDGDVDDDSSPTLKSRRFKDLWDVSLWDRTWLSLSKRKSDLRKLLIKKSGTVQEADEYLLQTLLRYVAEADSDPFFEDIRTSFHQGFAASSEATASGSLEISKCLGLDASVFARNLHGVEKHVPEDALVEPEQMAAGSQTTSLESILSRARQAAALDICKEPLVRKFVRDIYVEKSFVSTRPTLNGASRVDELHGYASVNWLQQKPLAKLNDAQWLFIEKAEQEGLVTATIRLPDDVELLQKFEAAYLSDGDSSLTALWNEERRKVLKEAIGELEAVMTKEMKAELSARARRWIASRCAEQLWDWASTAPYRRPESDSEENSGLRVLACCLGPGWKDTTCVALDPAGEVENVFTASCLGDRDSSEEQNEIIRRLTDFVHENKPDVCVLGASHWQCCNAAQAIRKAIDGLCELHPSSFSPEVVYGDERIAALYENSQCAVHELSTHPGIVRRAVGLGRFMQNPLALLSSLFGPENEILSLKLHPLQEYVPPEVLREALEQMMMTIAAQVGIDVNLAAAHQWLFGPLQFIAGLGERKACFLRRSIGIAGKLNSRDELLAWSLMKQNVFRNAAGFLRVRSLLYEPVNALDDTAIHPESYTAAIRLIQHALCNVLDNAGDVRLEDGLRHVRQEPGALAEIDIHEFSRGLRDSGYRKGPETLQDVRAVLLQGQSEVRKQYESPTDEQVFTWVTGKFPGDIKTGMSVRATVLQISKLGVVCGLDSGAMGLLQAEEEQQQPPVREGMALACTIQGINLEFMRLDLARCTEEAVDYEYYKEDFSYLSQLMEQTLRKNDSDKERLYKQRKIEHPHFQNISTAGAVQELVKGTAGEFIICPNTKGFGFLSLFIKICDGVNLHLDIWEGQKDAQDPSDLLRLGKVLKIQGQVYKDLDEVASRYVEPFVSYLRKVLESQKFKAEKQREVDECLRAEMEAATEIPCYLCICQDRPGELSLSYARSGRVSHEYVAITSVGYTFRNKLFESPDTLVAYFQQHVDDVDAPRHDSGDRNKTCRSCGEDGHMSRECPNKPAGGRACHTCGAEDHISRDCPDKPAGGRACHSCGAEDHISRDCPNKPAGGRACHTCGAEDHISRDCPNKPAGGRACHSCGAEDHISRDCPDKPARVRACHTCGAEDHISRDCPDKPAGGRACHSCGQEGHISRDCPTKSSSMTCRSCGKEGHFARECPDKADGAGGGGACYSCGNAGHLSRDCPNKAGGGENQQQETPGGEDAGWGDSAGWGNDQTTTKNDAATSWGGDQQNAGGWNEQTATGDQAAADGWGGSANPDVQTDAQGGCGESNGQAGGEQAGWTSETKEPYGDGGGKKRGACFNCNEEGHMSRECPNKPARARNCYNCGQEGHLSRECPSKTEGGGGGGGGGGSCFSCGQEGHKSRDCPTKPPRRTISCYSCGEEGHMSRDCPKKNAPNDEANEGEKESNSVWGADAEKNEAEKSNSGWGDDADKAGSGWADDTGASKAVNENKGSAVDDQQKEGGGTAIVEAWETRKRGACFSCNQEGHMSRECPNKRPRTNGECYSCGQEGHISRDCPTKSGNPSSCFTCGEKGHFSRECGGKTVQESVNGVEVVEGGENKEQSFYGGRRGPAAGRRTSCFACGDEGHVSKECPKKRSRKGTCFTCGEQGHRSRHCPSGKGGLGNAQAAAAAAVQEVAGEEVGEGGAAAGSDDFIPL